MRKRLPISTFDMKPQVVLAILMLLSICTHAQGSKNIYTPEVYFANGMELLEKSNYASARSSFTSFVKQAPGDSRVPDAEYFIAFSALNLYNLDAEELFLDFIEANETHPKARLAYLDLGNFYFQDKNYAKASEYYAQIDLNTLAGDLAVEARFKLGYSSFSQRKFEEALTHFNILKRQTNKYSNASAYYAAYLEYQSGDFDLALADLQKAEQSDSYKSVVPYFVTNIYFRQGRYRDATQYGESALSSGLPVTNARDIYLLTAESFYVLGEYKEAIEYYDQYESRLRGQPVTEVVYRIAVSHFRLKQNQQAIEYFKLIASQNDIYGAMGSYYLGFLYLDEGNLEYAASAFQIASEHNEEPNLAEKALYFYGRTSVDLGRSSEGITQLQKFIALYPRSEFRSEADETLSLAYLNSNNLDLAIEYIEALSGMTQSIKTSYQQATLLKGNQLYNQRRYREAIELYDKSIQNPVNNDLLLQARFWRSEAYSVGRRYEEAVPGYLMVVGSNSELSDKARYGLGYAYYNSREYQKAAVQLRQFTQSFTGRERSRIYQDALLRLADCHYVAKEYSAAIRLYRQVETAGVVDKDYLYLQLGMVYSAQGLEDEAKRNLLVVINQYRESSHMDEALFEYASMDFEKGKYQASIGRFSELIDAKPNSPYVPYALQRRGIAHLNLQNYGRTEEDYEFFLKHYPTHKEANNILLGLQEVLNLQNKFDEFDEHLAEYKAANPEAEGLVAVEFEAARAPYNNQNYDKAIQSLQAFISSHPNDYKVFEARYYLAESHYRKNEMDKALPLYYQILAENQIDQIIRVIQRIADLEFDKKNYAAAIGYYKRLEASALSKRQAFISWAGQMKSFFEVPRYDSAQAYANKILEEGPPNVSVENQANLYLGKVEYVKGNYDGALEVFRAVVERAKDVNAAEAQYLVGEVLHEQGLYRKSNEALFIMPTNFSVFEMWLGRSFLLVADNYMELGEFLQARATLNSIVENTNSGLIANLAKAKLTTLDGIESKRSEVVPEDTISTDTLRIDGEGRNGGSKNE